ncbi:MAG: hypothetical protein NWF01_05810 [Candidatus Bathyarchaeota archaeon]|nr:hypothetical protein [Candidatus Bathyarchaeota archaeon]
MKTIVLLCGTNEAGKTKTLKAFFGLPLTGRLKPFQLLERTLKGRKIFAVSLGSPQELEGFCEATDVKNNIQRRIQICEEKAAGTDYVLIIPFGVYQKSKTEDKLNKSCFLNPIKWLKSNGFEVIAVYLRKRTARLIDAKDKLIRSVAIDEEIESSKEYHKQAKELEDIIKKYI